MKNKKTEKEKKGSGVLIDILLCGFLSVGIETVMEICDWRSVSLFWTFFQERTWVFFYNCLIIFLTFLLIS